MDGGGGVDLEGGGDGGDLGGGAGLGMADAAEEALGDVGDGRALAEAGGRGGEAGGRGGPEQIILSIFDNR